MDRSVVVAIENGDVAKIREAIQNGADLNERVGMQGETLMHCYAIDNRENLVKVLIEAGADVNAPSRMKGTPLHSAAGNNNASMVKMLIEAGADVNSPGLGFTPLTVAVNRGYTYVAKLLIEAGANSQNDNGKALNLAKEKRLYEIVELLTSKNVPHVDPNANVKRVLVRDTETPYSFDTGSFASFIFYVSNIVLTGFSDLKLDGYSQLLNELDFFDREPLSLHLQRELKNKNQFILGNIISKLILTYDVREGALVVEHYTGRRELFNRILDFEKHRWGVFELERQ